MNARLSWLICAMCLLICGCQSTPTPDKSPTQLDMNREAAAGADKADQKMQKLLSDLRAQLDATGRAKLEASQAAWLAYRKAEAESYANPYHGGSMWSLVYSASLADTTDRRIGQLRFQLDGLKNR
ncbi:MAG TPA: lysozyme inhibitor LprI family protein [Verrucomicrobiae bacterium]|nr:lysozyme inhibitor LprI family protein [Verrucomicrobiae bacterium]